MGVRYKNNFMRLVDPARPSYLVALLQYLFITTNDEQIIFFGSARYDKNAITDHYRSATIQPPYIDIKYYWHPYAIFRP